MTFRTLAIDTSTPAQLVAYQESDSPSTPPTVAEEIAFFPDQMNHSRTLLRNIDALLRPHNTGPRDLDLVAISIGPGSFTGLRVGLAVAKALARAANASIVPVPTLDLFACSSSVVVALQENDSNINHLHVAIDARRSEVFTAQYDVTPTVVRTSEITAVRPATLLTNLDEDGVTVIVGNAYESYPELRALPRYNGDNEESGIYYEDLKHPAPAVLAKLGLEIYARDGGASLNRLEPNYIRPSDAKKPTAASVLLK